MDNVTLLRPPPKKVVWTPQPGSQTSFLNCPVPEILYEGTRGPGKTDSVLMKYAMYLDRGFGSWWRGILFRQTYPQLDEVVVKTRRWFAQTYPLARFNVNEYRWQFPQGETLSLRHMAVPDQYWNYHGHEYPIIIWEELCQWSSLDCYQIMKATWRSSYPLSETNRLPRFYLSTANPYGPGHNVVKAYFIDPAPAGTVIRQEGQEPRVRIHGSIYENKILLDADPNYIKQLEAIEEPNRRAAWLEGSWEITSGGMFDDIWRRDVHYIDPFPIPPSWRIDRSFDWGSSRPFSVGWWALSDGSDAILANGLRRAFPRGTLFRINEWYGWNGKANEGSGMLSSDIAKGIVQRERDWGLAGRVNPGPADTSIWTTIDGKSIATDMAAQNVLWDQAIKSAGSRKNGWELTRTRLMASRRNEGPGFYCFNTCPQFLRTFPVLPRDAKDPDDVDSSTEDHIGDETRYRVLHAERDVSQEDMF